MQHDDIWRAIDALAAQRGLSASALARSAGLDPTSFNPSKRRAPDGRLRWPSTESIAKILAASQTGFETFAALAAGSAIAITDTAPAAITDAAPAAITDAAPAAMIPDEPPAEAEPATPDEPPPEALGGSDAAQPGTVCGAVPVIGLGAADGGAFDEEGYPGGTGWRRLERVIAEIGIVDDPHLFALAVEDESLEPVCRRGHVVIVSPDAPVRMGDLVVARLASGGLVPGRLLRRTISRIDLGGLNPAVPPRDLPAEAVVALQRIIWASQ
ncbi:unnamed protein product [Acidocella sp. C78]|uniref:S24 family peptidase n=1 Tax=Acidocella sp. C78 TaxID=1671486 RepID=UPI00191B9797|nr:helix-turn-helix transcriptional regulator [Acidocella sp. C78]CAG4923201.1 unnamed protein product [Acidocella sp. C78]